MCFALIWFCFYCCAIFCGIPLQTMNYRLTVVLDVSDLLWSFTGIETETGLWKCLWQWSFPCERKVSVIEAYVKDVPLWSLACLLLRFLYWEDKGSRVVTQPKVHSWNSFHSCFLCSLVLIDFIDHWINREVLI